MFRKLIATSPTWFTVPVRLALAAVMIAHGSQKVLGTFNGPGFQPISRETLLSASCDRPGSGFRPPRFLNSLAEYLLVSAF